MSKSDRYFGAVSRATSVKRSLARLRFSGLSGTRIGRFFQRLVTDQSGAVALMFMASGALIFGASLGAIDLIRYTDAKSRVQASLDNAALAAGRLAVNQGTGDLEALQAEAQAYFDAGFPAGYLGSTMTGTDISLTLGAGAMTVTFDGLLPLLSTGFLKVSSLGLKSNSVVQLASISDVEVVFALDKGAYSGGNGGGNGGGGGNGNCGNDKPVGNAQGCKKKNAGEVLLADEVDYAAAELARLLMAPDGQPVPGVYVGLVPFSSVVNVGPNDNPSARNWVARWQDAWPDTGLTGNRKQYSNSNYTRSVWRGCIAEPKPWVKPATNAVSALKPDAQFQPVFVRVMTELSEKGKGPTWKGLPLNGFSSDESVIDTYANRSVFPLHQNTGFNARFDRRLWAEFGSYSNGQSEATFNVYGAFEPENCLNGYRVRFLSDNYGGSGGIKPAIEEIASGVTKRGDTVIPAGLLWSWRMLHPDWRNADGWGSTPSKPEERRRVIVLFAGGQNAEWSTLTKVPSGNPHNMEQWAEDDDNRASFVLDYQVEVCSKNGKTCNPPSSGSEREHNQPPYLPVKKKQQAADWQRPTTSVIMADPFSDSVDINTSTWSSMASYTVGICNAIKGEGIDIYVVDVNEKATTELTNCSSSPILYTTSDNDLAALKNVIMQNVSSSQRLRLVR